MGILIWPFDNFWYLWLDERLNILFVMVFSAVRLIFRLGDFLENGIILFSDFILRQAHFSESPYNMAHIIWVIFKQLVSLGLCIRPTSLKSHRGSYLKVLQNANQIFLLSVLTLVLFTAKWGSSVRNIYSPWHIFYVSSRHHLKKIRIYKFKFT